MGKNGAGKSSFLDALSFALFGKAHRNITRPQLVNSVNQKNLLVEIEFTIGKDRFLIKRGLKPVVFEVYRNGHLYNQDSNVKDYQKFLEENILKLNYRSFHQVVVLGSSNFTPFMSLTAAGRRDVVEDLLDIGVFGTMQALLKTQHAKDKEFLSGIGMEINLVEKKIAVQESHIHELNNINDDIVQNKLEEIDDLEDAIEDIGATLEPKRKKVDAGLKEHAQRLQRLTSEQNEHIAAITIAKQEIKTNLKQGKFFSNNDECPTCTQSIDAETKRNKADDANRNVVGLIKSKMLDEELLVIAQQELHKLGMVYDAIMIMRKNVAEDTTSIRIKQSMIDALNRDITALESKTGDTGKAKKELNKLRDEREVLRNDKLSKSEEINYNLVLMEMLKDSGIKSKIAKQYLPVINNLINHYLHIMDFYVSFNLNETFTETIKSRHRDVFSYESFSEGEKSRIDLALLFTWRQVAKMKNSVATNLLILDELFDSSLDNAGVDNLLKILQDVDEDTNIFVISHKGDMLDGKFRSKIVFKKTNNFSRIE